MAIVTCIHFMRKLEVLITDYLQQADTNLQTKTFLERCIVLSWIVMRAIKFLSRFKSFRKYLKSNYLLIVPHNFDHVSETPYPTQVSSKRASIRQVTKILVLFLRTSFVIILKSIRYTQFCIFTVLAFKTSQAFRLIQNRITCITLCGILVMS